MKKIAYTLILTSVSAMAVKALLPKGKKSPFYGPMKFLISIVLLFILFSPFLSLLRSDPSKIGKLDWEVTASESTQAAEEIILNKSREQMESAAKSAFPEADFTLQVDADENQIPTGIRIFCEDGDLGRKIAIFLQTNYSILTTAEETKGSDER